MADVNFGELRQVGEFNHHLVSRRRLIRSIKNPLDKCTVVSIYPKPICELKPTIDNGKFFIDPGTYDKPSTLLVGGSAYWRDVDADQPMIEIPISSVALAESIVKDYCNSVLGSDMNMAMPGLFFVLGEVSSLEIKTKYKKMLDEMKVKQDNWYKILVNIADALWARGNGNPLTISDEMRLAARSLNMNEKPWLKDFSIVEMVKCRACGSLKHPDFPVCAVCRAVDMAHPNAKDLKFAQG